MKNLFSKISVSVKNHVKNIEIFHLNNDVLSEMTIRYSINNKEEKIKIFGEKFIDNNKDKCNLIIYGKEYRLCEYIDKNIIENNINNYLEIRLKETQKITNMSYMFSYCNSLLEIPDISNWNTKNVTDMSCMFSY
jgi:surface protein